jgi:aspartate/methionine/tyrosine aminotransferase
MPIEVDSPEQHGYGRIACNLAESSVRDARLAEAAGADLAGLGDLVLAYADHSGHAGLRGLIAEAAGREAGLAAADVLLTAGAAQALFAIATALLEPGDEIVVARPNYATNIETPRALGARVVFLDQRFEDGFRVDLDALERLVGPRTRLVSLTSPHNPTGQVIPEADLRRIVAIVERTGAYLLLDETYRDLSFAPPPPLAAALSPRAISVSSVSKAYGLPGLRVGWLVARDAELRERLLAAKEQIGICGSVIDEELAYRAVLRREAWLGEVHERVAANLAVLRAWLAAEPRIACLEPRGGVVALARIRPEAGVDADRFHATLREEHATWVGPGPWFELEPCWFRIGFGWPTRAELEAGLENVSRALTASA